jgi:hypothetical protein
LHDSDDDISEKTKGVSAGNQHLGTHFALSPFDVHHLETTVKDPDETEDVRDNERRVDEASIFKSYKMKIGRKKKNNRNRTYSRYTEHNM